MERLINRQERVVIRTGLLLAAMLLAALGQPAQALVVCAKADRVTGQPRANAKLKLRAECRAGKEVALGIEVSGTPGTDGKVVFDGVNVQVLDGSGDTAGAPNGLGNLIVGYNEDTLGPSLRTGSHNLVVGPEHDYQSFGGFVAGFDNLISGPHASVSGGLAGTASGEFSSIGGGEENSAEGPRASVGGGSRNTASGPAASVCGGVNGTASGDFASVGGGELNVASGLGAAVSGGKQNTADGSDATVSGGFLHSAPGVVSWKGGGDLYTTY